MEASSRDPTGDASPFRVGLLEFGRDLKFLRFGIVGNPQDVGLAADLAVFDVALRKAGGFVHRRFVPLTAASALESWGHLPYSKFSAFPETKLYYEKTVDLGGCVGRTEVFLLRSASPRCAQDDRVSGIREVDAIQSRPPISDFAAS